MSVQMIIELAYKVILTFFVLIFVRNMFRKDAKLSEQALNAFILVPFVLRLLSIR